MITQFGKRALSLFLAVIMVLSAVPMQVFATDNHDHEEQSNAVDSISTEAPEETSEEVTEEASEESGESEAMIALRAEIAAYLDDLGITPDMPDQMLLYAYSNHTSYEAAQASLTKLDEFEQKGALLSKEEQKILLAEDNTKLCQRYREVAENAYGVMEIAECTVNGVKFSTTSGSSSVSASGSTVTATVSGKDGSCGGSGTAAEMVLYVTNTSDEAGVVSFTMTKTNVNSIKGADGEDISGMGTYSRTLAAGEDFTITVTTGANSTQNKLELTDIAFTPATQKFTVTVEYPTAAGSITSPVAGTSVDADGVTTMTIPEVSAADGVTLTANSSTFLCWVDKDNKLLSKDKSYTVKPSADTTVKALMNGNQAHFVVNGSLIYDDLNEAVQMAATASNKTIVLMNNGTLPAGDYTIPSGVTLLIPYNDANTLCTTAPTTAESGTATPTVYRKLTMAEGANITVNGAMSLSATQTAGNGRSSPIGACSFVQMASGSSITVNKGGNLYAWGYIQGSGAVTVKNGATVYECFQVMDWRGGDNTSGMIGNSYRVFPFSQYYVQNVEVPMTLEAGATEKGYMSITISMIGVQESAVPFIGSDGMFNINSGYIVKDYDESTGRLNIDVHGGLGIKSLSLSMKLGLFGSKTINSKDYVLPINGNMTITMHDGGSINMTQDIALQPGARLIVEEGASCTLGSGNSIYVYDYDEWITEVETDTSFGTSFCGTGDVAYVNLPYPKSVANNVSSRAQDAYVEINGTADLSAGYVYTTKGGANIRGTGTIVMQPGKADAKTYQVKHGGSDSKTEKWVSIPITSAKLTNADNSVVETADDLGKVTYTSVNGVWTCVHSYAAGTFSEKVTTAATCEATGVKTITCNCGDASKTEEIAALGHDYKTVVTAPTCTEAGYTTHTCQNGCGNSYTDTPVEALGHTPGAEADCEHAQTCTVCSTELVAALGHTPGAKADCEHAQTCTVCGKELAAALGHTPGAEADCAHAQICTVCGTELKAALGHKWEWVVDKAATVLEAGVKHEECSVCHEKQNENTEIPMLECSHKDTMTAVEAKENTCTEDGNSAYFYCSACQNYYSDEAGQHEIEEDSWIIPAAGHKKVFHTAQAATCTEFGWETYVTCEKCDYTTYTEIPALGHDEIRHEAQAPTCKAVGWKAFVSCSRCDYTTYEELPVDPEAHVWDEGEPYKKHSCNSASYMKYTCTLCGATDLVLVREQHFRVPIAEEIPATCTTDGMTSGWKCEKCDEFYIPQEVIPALGHDWDGNYPCQHDHSACTRCGLSYDTKQEHQVVIDEAVAATCTTTGLTEGSHCGYCGEILKAQNETPVADHNWIVADMEIPATCGSVGHKEGSRYCMDCDYDEDPIPALEHEWMHRDAKKATYSAIGWNAHDYCLLCKAIKTLDEYEDHPCEDCGENPEGYVEIPMVEVQEIKDVDTFIANIAYLEMMAEEYAKQNPGTDPLGLVLNYMRTAVANYTTGSWAIMAGSENKDFLKFVQEAEDATNSNPDIDVWVNVSGLKKLGTFLSPVKEQNAYKEGRVSILQGHFFGTMDMTYYNKGSQNHADVGGWVGDLTDLLSTSDQYGVPADLTLDKKVEYIRENYLFKTEVAGAAGSFGPDDLYADLDGYYFMNELITKGYKSGDLSALMRAYFYDSNLSLKQRVSYLLTNRLDGLSTRKDLRTAVYNAYTSNKMITTLEGTRNFNASGNELAELRKAVCYAFADEICRIAGDYVEDLENPRFTVFDTETKILAPGVSQQINYATNADGNQIVYYVATADVTREDVGVWVNYYDRDPGTPENPQWRNNSVPSSAQNAQDRYGDPESEDYIENFNVIVSTNAGGYDMSDTATPGGLMVMNGVEWHPQSGTAGFFAILDDGTAYMGKHDEYKSMMAAGKIQEAIGGFGEFVVMDGKVVGSAAKSDAPRTSVGITATGRVVLMCIDGRQAPFSSGASLQDVGYIMKEAGCVVAINLDGGGSTTFVARQPGSDDLSVMNRPSDGYPRNVSTNLLVYSTAPSSTKFDHAVIESEYDYATIGTPVQMTAAGVSPSGNAVDVPEGATWAVSDEAWASITEDGVFTGKRMGEVYVYLMLDGKTVGSKLMTITNPDQVYFEKSKVDAIYGSGVVLPLRARVEGKPIAINAEDVSFTLSAPKAGSMNGFTFMAAESTVKTMTITASLNESTTATINIMLYKQGENSFDFDKATGGDRMLAWDRQVSNAKVEDGNIYNVIDPSKDMVTSYVFALDMTAIPIPERLEELTYMLPGGTMEGTNAWSFLTSLAQRISNLTWVKATIDIDDRFDVDYSELKVLNDYFEMKEIQLDETTNTLTVTLNWVKQSQVIDMATANPLCIINGIKLTPKDGVWEDATKINAVTSGSIGYEIYMRASGLYSFAQKPESQAVFGVYPYRNPDDTTDAGGYFKDTYAEISDEYTLVNVLKEGWVNEDGGFAYYVNGERLTGVQKVDDFYYDFGEKGVNVGQTKYTGLFQIEGANYYAKNGELTKGWYAIGDDWYLFNWQTGKAYTGTYKTTIEKVDVTYEIENGKLVKGYWHETEKGLQYFFGPYLYAQGMRTIDGKQYIFENFYVCTGIRPVDLAHSSTDTWYEMTDRGVVVGLAKDGLYWYQGKLYYVQNAVALAVGLHEIDGEYYYFQGDHSAVVNKNYWANNTNGLLPEGTYRFGPDGKANMSTEIANENGILYYYKNGKRTANAGLVVFDGAYYFIDGSAKAVVNSTVWVTTSKANGLRPQGSYSFDADGKMIILNGIVDGIYYVDGTKTSAGLFEYEGAYYFAGSGGKLVTNQSYWVSATNGLVTAGTYRFDAEGKMIRTTEVVNENGTLYYYRDGKRTNNAGLVMFDSEYYYIGSGAMAVNNQAAWVAADNAYGFTAANYWFGTDGKLDKVTMVNNEDGTLYYYKDGKRTANVGIVEYEGAYYYIEGQAKAAVNARIWVTNAKANGYWPEASYDFGADGKMIIYNGVANGFYYVDGIKTAAGLIEYEGDYYYASAGGKLITSQSFWISNTKGLMPAGTYRFNAEGKMNRATELFDENGVLYYYKDGRRSNNAGLIKFNGDYYCIGDGAMAVTNQAAWVAEGNAYGFAAANYWFGEDGKLSNATMVNNEGGVLYYYKNGRRTADVGIVEYEGAYYYIESKAKAAVNTRIWVTKAKSNGYWPEASYDFGADGKLIIYNGVANGFYYVDGIKTAAGLIEYEGNYYFAGGGGKLVTNQSYWVGTTNGLVSTGTYRFDAEGKMLFNTEVVDENGTLYYYKNGKRTNSAGLIEFEGAYYYIGSGAIAVTNKAAWIAAGNAYGFAAANYWFGEDGKLSNETMVNNEDGVLYYYKNGKRTANAGLIEFEGAYYYIEGAAKAAVSKRVWISTSKSNGLCAQGSYDFDAEGKMIIK